MVYVPILWLTEISFASAYMVPSEAELMYEILALMATATLPRELEAAAKVRSASAKTAPPCRMPSPFRWLGVIFMDALACPSEASISSMPLYSANLSFLKNRVMSSLVICSHFETMSYINIHQFIVNIKRKALKLTARV